MLLPSLLWFSAAVWAGAGEPPGKEVSQYYIGEGGGFQPPSGEASDYLENGAREHTGQGTFGPVLPTPPRTQPKNFPRAPGSKASPEGAGHGGPAGHAASPSIPFLPAQGAPDRQRYSLWEGLSSPLELPPGRAKGVSSDQASALVRQDYETHILQSRDGPTGAVSPEGALAGPAGGEIFVALELSGSEAEPGYRDAVAGLSRLAQFREDSRFRARAAAGPGRVSLWGWMPAHKLGEALKVPSVARVEVQRPSPDPRSGEGLRAELVIGIRISDPASIEGTFSRVMAELGSYAGFRWKKTVGYQKVPGSSDLALVVIGEVPMRQIRRVLAHSDVLKVMPSPAPPETSPPRFPAATRGRISSFISYAAGRNPLLVLLTLLVLIPLCVRLVFRLILAFIPYR
ncbi:MAG: hypothetical protein HY921_09105 [Elusimicrobia bacterium]|nr:hypothetical protein [Elusimicrobiota bacterium]